MDITVENIGKRYLYEWIFKKINFHFKAATRYAILGTNGSGKSTFLKIISGHLSPSKGAILYQRKGQNIDTDELYKQVSFAAPYIELIEEFTLQEAIEFHQKFKSFRSTITTTEFLQLIQLEHAASKEIRFFSSGMKQRLKLGLAFYAQHDILLLDEPTTNMDKMGLEWYQEQINNISNGSIVIIASNQKYEYEFVNHLLL